MAKIFQRHLQNKKARKTKPKGLCFLRNGSLWMRTLIECKEKNQRKDQCFMFAKKLKYNDLKSVP